MRISRLLILATLLAAGCYVRNQLPDLSGPRGAEYYFPQDIPAGCGPRANEHADRHPSGDLRGLHVERQGDEYVLTWASEPYRNDLSPMQAVATGRAKVHLAYPETGAPASYSSDEVSVEIEPGGSRLLSGTIRVPVANVSPFARGYSSRLLFDSVEIERAMNGIVFKSADLSFDYLGSKDGMATARWHAQCARATLKATARASNAEPVTLDTATWDGKATCTILDKDGQVLATDPATPVKEDDGLMHAYGFIRLPEAAWKAVDWKRATVRWAWTDPAEKPQSRTIRLPVRAYCAGPCAICQTTGHTAKDTDARRRGIASDWTFCRPWAQVEVSGYGTALVDDTGGALRRAWRERQAPGIEVRFPTHAEARAWGVRWMDVVIREG